MSITIANNNIASSDTLTINSQPLSKVAFSNSYNDLNDKPSFGQGQVINEWISDDQTAWYRVFACGLIEQCGTHSVANSATQTISFPRPFTKCVISIVKSNQGEDYRQEIGYDINAIWNITLTGFETFVERNHPLMYIAFGY